MAWTRAQLEFRFLGIGPGARAPFSGTRQPAALSEPAAAASRRIAWRAIAWVNQALWAYGISGDLPMLAGHRRRSRNLPLVREVLLAHAYWRLRGFKADLIILNQEAPATIGRCAAVAASD